MATRYPPTTCDSQQKAVRTKWSSRDLQPSSTFAGTHGSQHPYFEGVAPARIHKLKSGIQRRTYGCNRRAVRVVSPNRGCQRMLCKDSDPKQPDKASFRGHCFTTTCPLVASRAPHLTYIYIYIKYIYIYICVDISSQNTMLKGHPSQQTNAGTGSKPREPILKGLILKGLYQEKDN